VEIVSKVERTTVRRSLHRMVRSGISESKSNMEKRKGDALNDHEQTENWINSHADPS
jgi:hypothetical protein